MLPTIRVVLSPALPFWFFRTVDVGDAPGILTASLAQETEPGDRANDPPAAYLSLPYRHLGSSGMEALWAFPYASAHFCTVLFSSVFAALRVCADSLHSDSACCAGGIMDRW